MTTALQGHVERLEDGGVILGVHMLRVHIRLEAALSGGNPLVVYMPKDAVRLFMPGDPVVVAIQPQSQPPGESDGTEAG